MALLAVFGVRASDPTLQFARAIERTILHGDDGAVAQAGEVRVSSKRQQRATGDKAKSQPTPTPSPSPTGSDVQQIIVAAATEFGVDPSYMLAIAECESTFNPNAYHPAGYHGLFQFDYTTWGEFGYGSIYDPVAQARTTARLLAMGESDRWPICGLR